MKATKKTHKAVARRWSLGVFQSAANGEPIVAYCRKDGTIAPYLAKTVTTKKARVHAIFVGVT